jgi:hypothetical protein
MAQGQQLVINIGSGLSLMIGLPRIATWKTAERPKQAKRGTFGFNIETNNLEYWDGSNWLASPMSEA